MAELFFQKQSVRLTYDSLDPVNGAGTKPDQITRFLNESIERHIVFVQVIGIRPPWPFEIIDAIPEKYKQNTTDQKYWKKIRTLKVGGLTDSTDFIYW